jgi:type III restriction enzyme
MTPWHRLEMLVREWRESNYDSDFPLLAEILFNQHDEAGELTYLRDPQFHALEVYWFLRVKLGTPQFIDLYKMLFTEKAELVRALGLSLLGDARFIDVEGYLDAVKNDSDFARKNDLSTLRESLDLDYPSYIMALTMGAGKTVLIGTIIATEFAMSLEYRDKRFMKNALVFAPGTTIIESLKEISDIPYDRILPDRISKKFQANLKLVYARTSDKDIRVDRGGSYHIVVTNTEKIALKKRPIKRGQLQFDYERQREQDQLIANARLTTLASLPQLGVFSDEAHHTYGSKLGDDLKRVRETINHLHVETDLICVVNTTGTPYAANKTLKDVVFWYSLDQGIKDNILKSLTNSVIAYDFKDTPPEEIFDDVIMDFFRKYRDTKLVTGQCAKLAFYFKSQEHLDESRAHIEHSLAKVAESPALILVNTQHSSSQEIEEFRRLNSPEATKRVILLVGKGTEGWNCPSLFGVALIRQLTSANNFILQASTRCLRQVGGNNQPATIYIESRNQRVLNEELQKTLGTTLHELSNVQAEINEVTAVFRKTKLPKLEITRVIKRVVKSDHQWRGISLHRPSDDMAPTMTRGIFTPRAELSGVILSSTGEETTISFVDKGYDLLTAAQRIADNYHLEVSIVYEQLVQLYSEEVPYHHFERLCEQVEQQITSYEVREEFVKEVLALIKFSDEEGNPTFKKNGEGKYYHTIRYRSDSRQLITRAEEYENRNPRRLGFHYSPYNFDSEPEQAYFSGMLERLQLRAADVEDIFFTGGITTTSQSDLYFQYKGSDSRYHNYFPDFVITKKDGSFLIVEIKALGKEDDPEVRLKEREVRKLENLPQNKFKYHILYTDTPIPASKMAEAMEELQSEK